MIYCSCRGTNMKLWEKIRKLFTKKPKMLMAENKNETTQERKERFHKEIEADLPIQGTIDNAIDQYLKSLYYFYEQDHTVNSYKALTRLEGHSNEEAGNNAVLEEKLIQRLQNDPSFDLRRQLSSDGKVAFYHILSKGYFDLRKGS